MKVSTSLICCDLSDIKTDIDTILDAGFNNFHADFMDGHFVPRYGISPELIQWLKKRYGSNILIDSHLMVSDPYTYMDVIAPYSSDYVIHYEAVTDPTRTLQMLRKKYPDVKTGVAFNTCTPSTTVNYVSNFGRDNKLIDEIMFMGISPGVLGTRSFTENVQDKCDVCPLPVMIDGSVNYDTLPIYKKLEVDLVVSGTSMMFKPVEGITSRKETILYNIKKINEIL